jgi:phage tail-like protein
VTFAKSSLGPGGGSDAVNLCSGAFSECTGLEATMEPKVIKAGGANYGAAQRAGPVTFATVILKRGMTKTRDLWKWFDLVNSQAKYAFRLDATITMLAPPPEGDTEAQPILEYSLRRALPIKFKAADLNARGSEVGIEELHLAHEGFFITPK